MCTGQYFCPGKPKSPFFVDVRVFVTLLVPKLSSLKALQQTTPNIPRSVPVPIPACRVELSVSKAHVLGDALFPLRIFLGDGFFLLLTTLTPGNA